MAQVRLSARAFADLERIFEFIADRDPARALQTVQRIREAVMILERHPLIGRPVEEGRRELVIAHGRGTYVALYRWFPAGESVLVLAIRHGREAGHED
jgi:plasmid stabilization system protein ParE